MVAMQMAKLAAVQTILKDIPTGIVKEVPMTLREVEFKYVEGKEKEREKYAVVRVPSTGNEYTVKEPVCYDLLYYWRTEPELQGKSVSDMPADELTAVTAALIVRKPKDIKLQIDESGEVISVRSQRARQVNWQEAMKSVFDAVHDVYGVKSEDVKVHTYRSYTVKLPISTDTLQFYCEIYSGSNIGRDKHRSIQIAIRGQTIAPLTGMEAPCMNWCTFKDAKYFFGITDANLLQLKGALGNLGFTTIHTEAGKGKLNSIVDMFNEQKQNIETAGKLIDEYVNTPLNDRELRVLTCVYAEKFKLPKYVVEDIPSLINEKSIWGLSNAFSFFRTHCEYKKAKVEREEAALTKNLEYAAGELIVASPLLAHLQKTQGEITKKVLFPIREAA